MVRYTISFALSLIALIQGASNSWASSADLEATTLVTFWSGNQIVQVDPFRSGLSYQAIDRWDRPVTTYWSQIPRDYQGRFTLLKSGVVAPSAWSYIEGPLNVALAIGSLVAPEIMPAALALGLVGGYFDTSAIDAIGGGSEPLIPPQLSSGINNAMPYVNAANLIRHGINFALSLNGDQWDRTGTSKGELTIDRSGPTDRVIVEFSVDTTRGDPIGWIRTAPVAPGGTLSSNSGILIKTDRVSTTNPFLQKVRMHLYPKKMPVGTYDLVLSTKETSCAGCMSAVHLLRVKIVRTCVPEGLAPVMGPDYQITGCQECSPFEKIGPTSTQSWACVSCGPGGYRDPANPRSCISCAGETILKAGPACEACPVDTRANRTHSACIPQTCDQRELGYNNSRIFRENEHFGDSVCTVRGGDIGATWIRNCTADQYFERERCYFCPSGQTSGLGGRASCRVPTSTVRPLTAPTGAMAQTTCFLATGTVGDADRPGKPIEVQVYRDGRHPVFADGTDPAGTLVGSAQVISGNTFSIVLPPPSTLGFHTIRVYAIDDRLRGWNTLLTQGAITVDCSKPNPNPVWTVVPLPSPAPTTRPIPIFPIIR